LKKSSTNHWRNLWVFGDSYTTPYECVNPRESFWGKLAECADIPTIVNCSRRKNSFDSVMQLVIGLHQQFDLERDVLLIGVPPLERITVFDMFKDTPYKALEFNTASWQEQELDILCHRSLISLHGHEQSGNVVVNTFRTYTEVEAMRKIFLLTQWLDQLNAHYIIVNLEAPWYKNNRWPPSEFLLDYCLSHQRCILFDNTYRGINIGINRPEDFDLHGWAGHHGPAGNQHFFSHSLWPKFVELELESQ